MQTENLDVIKGKWDSFYPKAKRKGIVCPLCGNGSGSDGDGMLPIPRSKGPLLKCFVCGFSGSIIDLYMEDHKVSFPQAVSEMGEALGLQDSPWKKTGSDHPQAEPVRKNAEEQYHPEEDYSGYFLICADELAQNIGGQEYLTNRGIHLETAQKYMVGYDPNWTSPTVIRRQEAKGKSWRPKAKPCIIFPCSPSQYVARDARAEELIPQEEKRYKKTNEGRSGLFGVAQARSQTDGRCIFVVEGAFDALSVAEAGYAAIALNSTSNVKLLLQEAATEPFPGTLVICLDQDEAGQKAAVELRDGLQRLNCSCAMANISGGYKDPNEALVGDREGFIRSVQHALVRRPDNVGDYLRGQLLSDMHRNQVSQLRKTGLEELDRLSGGLYPGLYVIASTSSLGKTTFCLQIADHLAATGHDVCYFSLEQSRLELVTKSLSRISRQSDRRSAVSAIEIRQGKIPQEQMNGLLRRYADLVGDRLSIIEGNFNCDMGMIRDYCLSYRQQTGKTPIVMVDYLQILQPASDGKMRGSKKDEIDQTMIELRRLAREMETPVIAISSVNRANYLQPISFEGLKESGGIEYTSDVIWGLELSEMEREQYQSLRSDTDKRKAIEDAKLRMPREITLRCLKNRYGVTVYRTDLLYEPQYDLFVQSGNGGSTETRRRVM